MELSFPKKIAVRYLYSKRSEAAISLLTAISILGVAIGVAVLTVVMAVMTGFETELKDKILGADSHITVRPVTGKLAGWSEIRSRIANVPGVTSVSPYTYHQALLQIGERSTGILIRGIQPNSQAAEQLQSYVKDASALKILENENNQLPGIIIGRELSRQLNLSPGTKVSLLAPQVSSSPFGLMPRFKRFSVIASYQSGLVEYEQGLAYVSLTEAQRFFRMEDTISGFEVRVEKIDEAPKISKKILESLGGLASGVYAQDWTETNKPFFEALKLEQRVYFIVLLLIIVMASFSIISSLIMVVIEKRKDIAVLRTMGATQSDIANIFRIQGAVIGAVGVLLGISLGLALCVGLKTYGFPIDERIFQMSTLPININLWNFVLVGCSAFAICCVATLYPASRASKLEPTQILRFE